MLGYQINKKHNCNPFQSAPSLFIRYSFGSCWVIYTSSACSEQSFLRFTQFGGSSDRLNFDTFRDTAPQIQSFSYFQPSQSRF